MLYVWQPKFDAPLYGNNISIKKYIYFWSSSSL